MHTLYWMTHPYPVHLSTSIYRCKAISVLLHFFHPMIYLSLILFSFFSIFFFFFFTNNTNKQQTTITATATATAKSGLELLADGLELLVETVNTAKSRGGAKSKPKPPTSLGFKAAGCKSGAKETGRQGRCLEQSTRGNGQR